LRGNLEKSLSPSKRERIITDVAVIKVSPKEKKITFEINWLI